MLQILEEIGTLGFATLLSEFCVGRKQQKSFEMNERAGEINRLQDMTQFRHTLPS